jgi:hypothetical protein
LSDEKRTGERMRYLYLDESGDLGFDFITKKPSKYFTVTILAIEGQKQNRRLLNSVKKTLRRKFNNRKKRSLVEELKGYKTLLEIKKYFYNQIKSIDFKIFSISLDKKKISHELTTDKDRLYNYAANDVLHSISFEEIENQAIELIVDKSKPAPEIREFNAYIRAQLKGRINPKIPLNIYHWDSKENMGLQACDMFCWGIFQKRERNKAEWYNLFTDKIVFDSIYSP